MDKAEHYAIKSIVWSKRSLTGFDSAIILYGLIQQQRLQTSPVQLDYSQPGYDGFDGTSYRPNCITDDSVYIAFNASALTYNNYYAGYHLGGVKDGKWTFKTALADSKSYSGDFLPANIFEVGNGVNNGGSSVVPLGNTFIMGYSGEFWKSSETNMFNHYYSDGLVINQFGVANGFVPSNRAQNCYPGDAGNAFSHTDSNSKWQHLSTPLTMNLYKRYSCWKITGMNTIKLLTGKFSQ